MKVAVLDDYQAAAEALADWSGHQVRFFHDHLEGDALVAAIADREALVVMRERTPLPAALLARLPALKLIVTSGMRNASIDVAAAKARGIAVCGTTSSSAPPAELAWALILGLARNVVAESTALATNGPWQSTVGADLDGRTLGLLGLGKIGSRMAKIGLAFGMRVVAWSANLTRAQTDAVGVTLAESKDQLLQAADFVSIHLVLGERTRSLIGAAELARMKPTAYLVNTSRAGIVDTAALVAALRERRIAGAGVDVFDVEPLPPEDPIRSLPNLLATPHLGYVTRTNYTTYFRAISECIRAFAAGAPVRTL